MTEEFQLNDNSITGPVPTFLGNLDKLVKGFQIQSNRLTGAMPTQLAQLTDLTERFLVNRNSLSSTIPVVLGGMTQIVKGFDLSQNKFDGTIPVVLAQLINLNSGFNLGFNKLVGTIPSELALLTDLTHTFSLKSNSLTGSIPLELSTLSLITDTFELSRNLLTGCANLGSPELLVLAADDDSYAPVPPRTIANTGQCPRNIPFRYPNSNRCFQHQWGGSVCNVDPETDPNAANRGDQNVCQCVPSTKQFKACESTCPSDAPNLYPGTKRCFETVWGGNSCNLDPENDIPLHKGDAKCDCSTTQIGRAHV